MIGSYTWAKSIDTTSGIRNQGFDTLYPQNSYCLSCERGLSSFDTRHRLVTSVLYDLPVGKGRTLNITNRVANAVIGDWQTGGIVTLQSGMPGTLGIGGIDNASTAAGGYDRPNATGISPYLSNPTPSRYWNPDAFVEAPPGQFGNVGRNAIIGPGIIGFDAEVHKVFRMPYKEGHQFQFRFEAFNVLNHPKLGHALAEHSFWGGAAGTVGNFGPSELRRGFVHGGRHAPAPDGVEILVLNLRSVRENFMRVVVCALLGCALCWGQANEECTPSALNIPESPYPCVHPDRRVTFRVSAPDAQKVQVRLGGAHDMTRGADGQWMVTIPPQVVGFHYYSIAVDGATVADPATRTFFGSGWDNSGIEIPEPEADAAYYSPKDMPHGQVSQRWYYSKITAKWRRCYVYTPPEYGANARTRYPVLYLLFTAGAKTNRAGTLRGTPILYWTT